MKIIMIAGMYSAYSEQVGNCWLNKMQIYDIEQSKDIHRSITISLHFKRKPSDGPKAKPFVCINERTERRENISGYLLHINLCGREKFKFKLHLNLGFTVDNQNHE